MESLEALQRQLGSLDDLRGIVKTMKALSAASIRQYEQAVTALAGYYQTVERGLQVALRDDARRLPTMAGASRSGGHAAVVFGTDHGLCGRFNEDIVEHALDHMRTLPEGREPPLILAVGARAAASLEHAGRMVAEDFFVPGSAAHITDTVQQILLKIDEWRAAGEAQSVHLHYNAHSGARSHEPMTRRLLPVDLHRFEHLQQEGWPSRRLPTYTMNRDRLLRRLIYQYLFVTVFRSCAESQASEHASRLAAMQAAERNLDERLQEVTQDYRRARQSVITSELLDVVAGFEAITTRSD